MIYKIFKKNNYVIVIDQNDNYFEEHCSQVLVIKKYTTDTVYDVIFVRPETTPQAFYAIPFANIRDEFNNPYASVAAWETWYTTNTGLCTAGTTATLSAILATLQAQSEVEGVFVKDLGNSDKVVLQVRVWDQDTQTFIATLYFNPDGTPYTPVGPVEWVGTGGSVNSTIVGPLGNTTTCGNAVAVTLCDALYTEFFAQGDLLDTINTSLDNIETDVDALLTAFNAEDFATQTTLAAVLSELQGTIDVNVTNTVAVSQSGTWTVQQGGAPWSVSGTVNIGTMPAITGTVALDVATLAALETINAVQSGTWTVALDSATLAALEDITVSGTVAATQSGAWSVSVSNFPATQNVNVTSIVEVEVKNDSGNPLPISGTVTIQDGGNVITVDGTVDSNLRDGAGNAITSTTIGADTALDVNIVGGVTLAVDLDQNNDAVQIYGSNLTNPIVTDVNGVLAIQDNGGSITVDATNLDIRDLAFATDKVDASGSTVKLQDGTGTGITSTTIGSDVGLDVNIIGTPASTPVSGSWYKRIVGNTTFALAAGATSVSIQNIGSDNVTVDTDTYTGEILDPGISLPWEAPANKTLNAFSFKGSSVTSVYVVVAIYP